MVQIKAALKTLLMDILFPKGNYRYYVLYIPSLIVLGVSGLLMLVMIMFLDQGMVIRTDTFVAMMPFVTSHRLSNYDIEFITLNYNIFGFIWGVFAGWITVSILADILYSIVSLYRRIWPKRGVTINGL